MSIRMWTLGASSLLLALYVGCSEARTPTAHPEIDGPPPEPLAAGHVWRPAQRFVPADPKTGLLPTATIGSETRPVLRSPEIVTLNYAPAFAVPADGRISLRPPLPPGHPPGSVYLWIRVKPGDRWESLPGRLAVPVMERGKLRVHVDFELAEAAGREAGIWVQAIASGERAYRSPVFRVPETARLDFATGILEPARSDGPVRFALSACDSGSGDGPCEPIFERIVDPSQGAGFVPRTLSLHEWRGREIALRFEATPENGGVSLPVWGDPTVRVPEPVAEPRNVILLSLDTLRADHVGAYGYARDTTPFLDALAGRGVLFENYVAASSSTRPSHMTMLTSLQPSVHGATENTGVRALPAKATTIAELFRRSGIATAAFTENGAIDRSRGFGRGFDVYVENRDAQSADLRLGHIEQTFTSGLDWLDSVGESRFFLLLHTYQVHNPFTPPEAYASYFAGDPGELAPPPELRPDWDPRLYDREIRYSDDRVRELVAALEQRGLLEDTWLVVTSDHGEAFLEHGFVAHGANVHHEVVNVPLIVTGPGVPAGRRLAHPVPMVDLMPTLLELMEVAPTGAEMGRSQAAAILGNGGEATEAERPIYSEAWAERAYRATGFDRIDQPTLALRLGNRKLIRSIEGDSYRYELYDLGVDPRERNDLYPSNPEAAADLIKITARYEAAVKAFHEKLGESEGGAVPTDPDLEEKLRALGYLE